MAAIFNSKLAVFTSGCTTGNSGVQRPPRGESAGGQVESRRGDGAQRLMWVATEKAMKQRMENYGIPPWHHGKRMDSTRFHQDIGPQIGSQFFVMFPWLCWMMG